MKALLLILSISVLPLQSFASNQSQIKECKSKFENLVAENMTLKFVCTDPATEGTRSSFIALQYSATEYTEDGQAVYLQNVIVCASDSGAASVNQSNDLVSGVGLLNVIGSQADVTYLDMMSAQNQRTLKRLSQNNCTDAQGRLLVD